MDGNNTPNSHDSIDINELASLNEDISPELIEQLQQKVAQEATSLQSNDDGALFEEPSDGNGDAANVKKQEVKFDSSFDDNFIKKYKARLNKQSENEGNQEAEKSISNDVFAPQIQEIEQIKSENEENPVPLNITERKVTLEQKNYNDSLDFLDGNVKYSKYVIYIDPQNVDFIESLTVKERKNLINKILREQDDIAISKHRFKKIQTIIMHLIIAIVIFTASVPVIYYTVNASLEATINNYRRSQANFKSLYREHGKISKINQK